MTFLVSVQAEVSPTVQPQRKDVVGCVQHYKDATLARDPSRGESLQIRELIARAAQSGVHDQ